MSLTLQFCGAILNLQMSNRFEFVSPLQSLCLEVLFCDMMFSSNFTSFIFVIGQTSSLGYYTQGDFAWQRKSRKGENKEVIYFNGMVPFKECFFKQMNLKTQTVLFEDCRRRPDFLIIYKVC